MLDDHKRAFIEEATELLSSLETGLLELEQRPDDSEIIASVFRALHTIKGSSGMFGFDDIAIFTHDVETIYDYIRNGQIPVTRNIIDLTLRARDQISIMLQDSGNENHANDSVVEDLVAQFRNIVLNYNMISAAVDSSDSKKEPIVRSQIIAGTGKGYEQIYYIYFQPAPNTFLSGTNPLLLLEELRQLGEAFIFHHIDNVPLLEELIPEQCCSYWEIILITDKGIDSVKDVFIFVEDDCGLNIEVIDIKKKFDEEELFEYMRTNCSKNSSASITEILHAYVASISEKKKSEVINRNLKRIKEKDEKSSEADALSSIRVRSEKLDNLVNLVGELVTVQARLTQTANENNLPELSLIAEEVERLTWELRDSALNIRMLPIGTTFSKFKRLVRDLSQELGKEVELITEGAETELDKTVIEKLNDPLVHIIRNCIDHGIETPDIRQKCGKPGVGKVLLSASQSGGNVLIKITDDGAGLNKELIHAKAVSNGLISPDQDLKDSEIFSLIFAPGFSTAKQVTNVSGRGVGMDVVKQAIVNLRGSVQVDSKPGEGTTIILKLPLTLAIIDGLLVKISDDFFILPLSSVEECIELSSRDAEKSNGRNLVNIRGEIIPYIRLRNNFNITGNRPPIEQIVITTVNNIKVGFAVDSVIGSHQTVLKNLGRVFRNVSGVSGATILGDGQVALILDTTKIIQDEEENEKISLK